MRPGIVAALPAEAKCLAGWPDIYDVLDAPSQIPPESSDKPLISVSGIGPEAGSDAALRLVKYGAAALISWGCAGSLSKNLQPGDLLIPQSILAENGEIFYPDTVWRKRLADRFSSSLKWHEDALVESNKMVSGVEEKQAMAHTFGAMAVDMESAAIGRVAKQAGIPFMVIRAVADTADEELPPCIAETMDNKGHLQMRRLFSALARQPRLWLQLIRLSRHFHAATKTLKSVSEQSGPLFHIV